MGATHGRGSVRGTGGIELSAAQYGAIILTLLAVAAATLLAGCSDDKLGGVSGVVAVEPASVDFGLVAVGTRSTRAVTLRNVGDAPFRLVSLEPEGVLPDDFVLPAVAGAELPIAGFASLDFGFAPGDEGRKGGAVLVHTDSAETPTIRITLGGDAQRPLVSVNRRLDFGPVVLNQEKFLRLTLVNGSGVPATVRLEGVEGEDAAHYAVGTDREGDRVVVPAGGSELVEARFFAGRLGRIDDARAVLEVLGGAEPRLTVELAGEGFASQLLATPASLDFGSVSPGAVARRTVTVENGGNRVVSFDELRIADGSGVYAVGATAVDGVARPLDQLAPGESATIEVEFSPPALSTYAGELVIENDDPTNSRISVSLFGRGGGADLLVTPSALDFGVLASGMVKELPVLVSNVGTPEGEPLRIEDAWVEPSGAFDVQRPRLGDLTPSSPPGELLVTFQPLLPGAFEATLVIESNDGDQPLYRVPLRGEARDLPPCQFVAEPSALSFGAVQLGATATLLVDLRNLGADECLFSSVGLARGTPQEFSLPDGPITSATVLPGGTLSVPVSVTPTVEGDVFGNLSFYVSDPARPQGRVQLHAVGYDGCLRAEPGAIDFGATRLSCPGVERTVTLLNTCGGVARITSMSLAGAGSVAGELSLVDGRVLTLPPGASATVTVRYDPADEGHDAAPLVFEADVLPSPLHVAVHGSGTANDVRTDRFVQSEQQAVDVLFVVDNSGSMMEEQQAIGAAFSDFIDFATTQNVDYHIGVTTTGIGNSGGGWAACPGGVDGGEAGRLFPADGARPRWIDPATANAAEIFADNVQVGICHWWEEGLEAAYLALTSPLVDLADDPATGLPGDGNLGFYRPDARLSVIIVTDEDDHSDREPAFYTSFFRGLKGAGNEDKVTVNGVLGTGCTTASGDGDKYLEVVQATGGIVESICTDDWGRSLANLAENVFRYRLSFPLSGTPVGEVRVTVDGRPVVGGVTYDEDANAVVFDEDTAPGAGAVVEVSYVPACGT